MASSPPHDKQRRELVRQYKQSGPVMGVYAIRNLATGRVLLGAGLNAEGALNRHRFELQLKTHRNAALQADWNALGAEAFRFELVDRLKKKDDPGFDPKAELERFARAWAPNWPRRAAAKTEARG